MNKRKLTSGILGVVLLVVAGVGLLQNKKVEDNQFEAEIEKVMETTDTTQKLQIKYQDGELAGRSEVIENDESYSTYRRLFEEGDRVIVVKDPNGEGSYIADYVRGPQLLVLFVIFVVFALIVTGSQGLGALVGMGLSFVVIFWVMLPLILSGYSPLLVAVLASMLIIPLTFYPSHGFNKKTNVAIFSTFLTLVTAGVLAWIFADYSHLTGFASEEVNFLKLNTANKIDFQGLIIAGIIISILGVLDDITISQASVVQQLKLAKKDIGFYELFSRSMVVGRDHIASLINTLILVYAGASLPMLLLFLDHSSSFQSVVNLEFISEEIVRTLIGSIALIMAVPITTLLASICSFDGEEVKKSGCWHH